MRIELTQHLINNVPSVNGNVFQSYMGASEEGDGLVKGAYLMVKCGRESADPSMKYAYDRSIEIWPYDQPDDYLSIDRITNQVIEALKNGLPTDDGGFHFIYRGHGSDFYDEGFKKITNGPIRFDIIGIRD